MKPHQVRALTLLAIVTAAGLAGTAVVDRQAAAAVAQMDRVSDALCARREARPRPSISSDAAPIDDDAFTHYERAAALAEAIDDAADVRPLLAATDPQLAEAPRRPTWRPVVDALLAGARSVRREFPRVDRAFGCANLLTYRRTANLALFEARAARHEGRGHDAVRITTAVMAMGAACVEDGVLINQMVGAAIVAIAVDAWPDDALRSVDEATLRALAAGLRRIDARLPTSLDLDAELVQLAAALIAVPDPTDWCGLGGWRYGFSARWMCADAYLALARTAERLRAAEDRPWPARQRVFEQELGALASMPNEAAQMIAPNLDACERQLRWNVAHLRLLRQAVALHLGAADSLADPLADGPLQVQHQVDHVTLASAGDDGRGQLRREVRARAQSTGARTSFTKR